MAVTAVDKELIKYFARLDEFQKKSLLELIKSFLKLNDEPMERATLHQYNEELNQAMERINKGEFTTLEELEKEMNSW